MKSIRREWREGKVRPIPGNPPHDRPVSRGHISRSGGFATIPSPPLRIRRRLNQRGPIAFLEAWRNLSVRWDSKPKRLFTRAGVPPPVGRPPCPVKDATGGTTRLLIVRDKFRPAIP